MTLELEDPLGDQDWPMTQAEKVIELKPGESFVKDGRLTFLGMMQAVRGVSGRVSWCRACLSYRAMYVCDNPKEESFVILFEDGSALRVCSEGAQVLHEIDFIGSSLLGGGHG